jgi:hypothetical protein
LLFVRSLIRIRVKTVHFKVDHSKPSDHDQMTFDSPEEAILEARRDFSFFQNYAKMTRIPVSEAIASLAEYVEEHQNQDFLVSAGRFAFPNPFKEKSACVLL